MLEGRVEEGGVAQPFRDVVDVAAGGDVADQDAVEDARDVAREFVGTDQGVGEGPIVGVLVAAGSAGDVPGEGSFEGPGLVAGEVEGAGAGEVGGR